MELSSRDIIIVCAVAFTVLFSWCCACVTCWCLSRPYVPVEEDSSLVLYQSAQPRMRTGTAPPPRTARMSSSNHNSRC